MRKPAPWSSKRFGCKRKVWNWGSTDPPMAAAPCFSCHLFFSNPSISIPGCLFGFVFLTVRWLSVENEGMLSEAFANRALQHDQPKHSKAHHETKMKNVTQESRIVPEQFQNVLAMYTQYLNNSTQDPETTNLRSMQFRVII